MVFLFHVSNIHSIRQHRDRTAVGLAWLALPGWPERLATNEVSFAGEGWDKRWWEVECRNGSLW